MIYLDSDSWWEKNRMAQAGIELGEDTGLTTHPPPGELRSFSLMCYFSMQESTGFITACSGKCWRGITEAVTVHHGY